MKFINEQELLREIKRNLYNVGGLYDYIEFLLSGMDMRSYCTLNNSNRTTLQAGKNNVWRLNRWLKYRGLGFRHESYTGDMLHDGDAAEALYVSDNTIYDTGNQITLGDVCRYWKSEFPFSQELAYRIIAEGLNALDLVKEYDYDYNTAWAIWESVTDWAKYELYGTYIDKTKKKDIRVADAQQLLAWAVRHGFPMEMITRFDDIFAHDGTIYPEDTIFLYQLSTVMHNECLIYRARNNIRVRMGDRYRPFYYDAPTEE